MPTIHLLRAGGLLLAAFVVAALQAQVPTAAPLPAPAPEDREWETIRLDAFQDSPTDVVPAGNGGNRRLAELRRAENLIAKADRAREFYRKHPRHGKAAEARRLEAILLINAVHAGETAIEGRVDQTVDELRRDQTLPESLRAEVVGTAGFMAPLRQNLQGARLRAAYEATARTLMAEFPGQPQGYEALLVIARDGEEEHGKELARELVDSAAPEAVKHDAKFLLARYRLVGEPLAEMLADAGDKDAKQAVKQSRPTLVYSWASWSPGSIALGKALAARNLAGINVIGVNLDEDTAAAQALAASSGLPGTLVYDRRGAGGALARRLKLNAAPQVYFADADGIVRDVRGSENFEQKLTQLGL